MRMKPRVGLTKARWQPPCPVRVARCAERNFGSSGDVVGAGVRWGIGFLCLAKLGSGRSRTASWCLRPHPDTMRRPLRQGCKFAALRRQLDSFQFAIAFLPPAELRKVITVPVNGADRHAAAKNLAVFGIVVSKKHADGLRTRRFHQGCGPCHARRQGSALPRRSRAGRRSR